MAPLKVGVLGCMAERLKTKLLETDKMVDLVAGPGNVMYQKIYYSQPIALQIRIETYRDSSLSHSQDSLLVSCWH